MAQQIVTIASGTGTSAAFLVEASKPFVVFVPSNAPKGWGVSFAVSSDSTTFYALHRPEGGAFTVASGGGMPQVGIVQFPPSPWAKLDVRGVAFAVDSTISPVSATIVQLNRL